MGLPSIVNVLIDNNNHYIVSLLILLHTNPDQCLWNPKDRPLLPSRRSLSQEKSLRSFSSQLEHCPVVLSSTYYFACLLAKNPPTYTKTTHAKLAYVFEETLKIFRLLMKIAIVPLQPRIKLIFAQLHYSYHQAKRCVSSQR